MNLDAHTVTQHTLSTDALAYYVGQDMLIKRLLQEAQGRRVVDATHIARLKALREEVREAMSNLGLSELAKQGVDRYRVQRAEIRVSLSGDDVTIIGAAQLTPDPES